METETWLPPSRQPCPHPESSIQFMPFRPVSWRPILILSSHLLLGLLTEFSSQKPWIHVSFPMHTTNIIIIIFIVIVNVVKHWRFKGIYGLMYSSRYFLPILIKFGVSGHVLVKFTQIIFHGNPSSGSRADTSAYTDGRTDRHNQANRHVPRLGERA